MYSKYPEKWRFLPELTKTYEDLTPAATKQSKIPTMTWVKYMEVIEAMHEVILDVEQYGDAKPIMLEIVMVNWLHDVAPEKVTPNNLKAIHEFACAIGDKLNESARFPPGTAQEVLPMVMPTIIPTISQQSAGSKKDKPVLTGGGIVTDKSSHSGSKKPAIIGGAVVTDKPQQSGGKKKDKPAIIGGAVVTDKPQQTGGIKNVQSQQSGGIKNVQSGGVNKVKSQSGAAQSSKPGSTKKPSPTAKKPDEQKKKDNLRKRAFSLDSGNDED